ncbi:MAG: hypothetical protein PHI28_13985, partial [Mangrovibacterium sp.]|nr:hypothetical protein [Mangrovibacterium sp.]
MKKLFLSAVIALTLAGCSLNRKADLWVASAPAGDQFVTIEKEGETIIPNGRIIKPAGKSIVVAPHPFGLTLSPDGNTAVTANSGTSPLSITIIRNILSGNPEVQQIPPGPATDRGVLASVFMGLAVSNDNQVVYVAGGQENKIFLFDLQTGEKAGYFDCSFVSDE